MLQDWDRRFPGRVDNMFTAMGNIVTSHMMDRSLFPFETIKATGAPVQDGDIAFDEEENCGTSAPAPASVIRLVRDDDQE
jgi:tRNA 2-thiocytidine biosynthesis protein TtcA